MTVLVLPALADSPSFDATLTPDGTVLIARSDGSVLRWASNGNFLVIPAPEVGVDIVSMAGSGKATAICSPDKIYLMDGQHLAGQVDLNAVDWSPTRASILLEEGKPTLVWGDERGFLHVSEGWAACRQAAYSLHAKAISTLHLINDSELGLLAITAADDRHVIVTVLATGERIFDVTKCAGWVIAAVPVCLNARLTGVVIADRVGVTGWSVENATAQYRIHGIAKTGLCMSGRGATWSLNDKAWVSLNDQVWPTPGLVSDPLGPPLVVADKHVETDGRKIYSRNGRVQNRPFELPAPLQRWLPDPAQLRAVGLLATGDLVEVRP